MGKRGEGVWGREEEGDEEVGKEGLRGVGGGGKWVEGVCVWGGIGGRGNRVKK